MDWLDLNQSINRTYGQLQTAFGSSQPFAGHRVATGNEVMTFLSHNGVVPAGTQFNPDSFYNQIDAVPATVMNSYMAKTGITSASPCEGPGTCINLQTAFAAPAPKSGVTVVPVFNLIQYTPLFVPQGLIQSNAVQVGTEDPGYAGLSNFQSGAFAGWYVVQNSGATPSNPILPTLCQPGTLCFNGLPVRGRRAVGGTPIYFDPVVATGYTFESHNALNFQTVLIPNAYGDGSFDLFLFDGTKYVDSGVDLTAGTEFDFATLGFVDGVSRFSLRGIEPAANVDPNDPIGFVTGLGFSDDGTSDFSMTPITFDTDATGVPEPGTLALLAAGLVGISALRRRTRS